MNKEKVYIEGYEIEGYEIEGYEIDTKVSSLGYREKKIQLMNGEIVIIDENFTHKSIAPKKSKFRSLWRIGMKRIRMILKGIYLDISLIFHRFLTVLNLMNLIGGF